MSSNDDEILFYTNCFIIKYQILTHRKKNFIFQGRLFAFYGSFVLCVGKFTPSVQQVLNLLNVKL